MKNLLFAMVFVLVVPMAQAGVWVEPYLGYLMHKDEYKSTDVTELDTSVENSYKTPLLGARLGYGMLGFSLGLDYSQSLGAFEYKQDKPADTSGIKTEYTSTNLGIYAGYKFPLLFRVWGTYFLKNKLELDSITTQDASDVTEVEGKGFALGAGYTGLPFVALNLEYRSITYDKVKQRDGTSLTLPYSAGGMVIMQEIEAKDIVLSVSVPFDL